MVVLGVCVDHIKPTDEALLVELLGIRMTGQCAILGAWSTSKGSGLVIVQHIYLALPIFTTGPM